MSTEPKKIIVIHHSADFDGIFSREIAKRHFGDRAEYIGWDYGDPVPTISPEVHGLFMIDISIDGMMDDPRLVWIDHHKTAMAKFGAKTGLQIDGVAACRLAWQFFFNRDNCAQPLEKAAYIERRVNEPLAVRLAGEYDIWDKRDWRADRLQHGLRSQDVDWTRLLNGDEEYLYQLLEGGRPLAYAKAKSNESLIKEIGFNLKFEGLTFLACNSTGSSSDLFTAGLRPEHDGCLSFRWVPKKNKWKISMRGAGKPDVDLSVIASKYGGGGHKQACGFECRQLPFDLEAAA